MNSEKVETWHGIIISPTQIVQKSRECYGKNWMHFVHKLDNLFRSIQVSDEIKLICYKGISFFSTYYNFRLFVHSVCTIQSDAINFQPFLPSFAITVLSAPPLVPVGGFNRY